MPAISKSLLKKKRKKKPGQKYFCKKADGIWGAIVHQREGCEMKGAGGLQCSPNLNADHIYTRSIKHMRHDLDNAQLICVSHHMWKHNYSILFSEWFRTTQPEKHQRLMEKSYRYRKPDYKKAIEDLTNSLHN